ncbi:putative CocE/NonD family hydrolase [Allocatelliglobosispora scoriae]|uniref:Putative CocE/NonD family hydrolase n=1 Tax=Allocatelliglobosispora scoriae TaxID=643052 RepID=A0A841C2K2_9ACTN|nr:CocE/NonD family hydrolase [Allocatelliglobosispora scoriae]MBB5873988.1 putative CocE/NonD family hydrolase [Allocatelliglobosispora scoriae]
MTVMSTLMARQFGLPPAETTDVRVQRDLRVPMPDGVDLLADRYSPRGRDRAPLVLARSPYGRRGVWGMLFGRLLAERGFQAVVQSCRGTFGSGGTFDPFGDERADGLATVAWLRGQDFYPGSFATAGPSYLGFTQWAIAGVAGAEHRGMATQVTTAALHHMIYAGGSMSWATMTAWMQDMERQQGSFSLLRRIGGRKRLGRALRTLPLTEADRVASGHRVEYFQQWLAHPGIDDAYWQPRQFADGVAAVDTPVSMVGGWHDFMLPWQLRDYAAMRDAGNPPQLTIGPWQHADEHSIRGWMADLFPFLGAVLTGSERRAAPVRIFVTGAEEWREDAQWPPAGASALWYLHPGGLLATAPPVESEPDRHPYDPADPTPSVGGPVEPAARPRVDNRELEARADVLVYTSELLGEPLEVIGVPSVELFVTSTAADVDVFARICDVAPDGTSINISDALCRVRPGHEGPVGFELWPVAHRFAAGHRLRLQVSGGAFPRYPRNLPGTTGSGESSGFAASERQIHHDPARPSVLRLPIPDGGSELG